MFCSKKTIITIIGFLFLYRYKKRNLETKFRGNGSIIIIYLENNNKKNISELNLL